MEKHKISLLYVEDEKILRSIYKKVLSEVVSELYIAEDGEEGLKLYKQHRPDLVLTDIKMPVMNGLEMAKKIRREDSSSRIIIMSAYGQPQYFMQAIESGVKGFLLKPVDNRKLHQIIEEQAKEILLEKDLREQEIMRQKAEIALQRSDAILKAVSYAAEKFLQVSYGEKSIPKVLTRLGKATGVSRVYIFENYTNKAGKVFTSQKYEWVCEGIIPQIDNPDLQNFPYSDAGFDRWLEILSKGESLYGLIEDFPVQEREVLEAQDIKSIVIVPVFTGNTWWGFIGFDDCMEERIWTTAELKALSAAADTLGGAITRNAIEVELVTLNNELEERVEERTKDLIKENNERRIAEMMLRESEEKYRQIFENANDGIMLTIDGFVQFINPKLYEMTGYLPKECIDKPFVDFIHPDYKKMVMDNHMKRLQGEFVPERYDIQIIDKKKRVRWIEIKSTLIQWENRPAVLTFLTDISERKKSAQELEYLNQRLEQRVREEVKKLEKQQQLLIQKSKLESMGELAAGIAHEINQPLVGISMGIDNISIKVAEKKATADYLQEKFKSIFEDIERIRNIINHVRIFSKEQEIKDFEKVDVGEVIKNALSMVSTQYTNHNVQIILDLKEEKLYTFGNKYKLEQVFLNLLSNAKHAVDEKEEQLSNSLFEKIIKIAAFPNSEKLVIIVEDNGIGIPESHQINIFDPFFTTKKTEIGTGLGLSISYGILKEMSGEISVESQTGMFTRMTITLPKFRVKEKV